MNTHKRYLIIVETIPVGYVIGFTDNFKKAKETIIEMVDKQVVHLQDDGLVLFENNTKYTTYTIHKTARYIHPDWKAYLTNGGFLGYILDTRSFKNFSLSKFLLERSKVVYAFDIEHYDTDKTVYVKNLLEFIAN